jgi:hypothetical protein
MRQQDNKSVECRFLLRMAQLRLKATVVSRLGTHAPVVVQPLQVSANQVHPLHLAILPVPAQEDLRRSTVLLVRLLDLHCQVLSPGVAFLLHAQGLPLAALLLVRFLKANRHKRTS